MEKQAIKVGAPVWIPTGRGYSEAVVARIGWEYAYLRAKGRGNKIRNARRPIECLIKRDPTLNGSDKPKPRA